MIIKIYNNSEMFFWKIFIHLWFIYCRISGCKKGYISHKYKHIVLQDPVALYSKSFKIVKD